jgi:hypothetical protein
MESRKFFYAGPVEGLILDCYRLAKYYGRPPDEFLSLPVSKINNHMMWTAKLIEASRAEAEDDG